MVRRVLLLGFIIPSTYTQVAFRLFMLGPVMTDSVLATYCLCWVQRIAHRQRNIMTNFGHITGSHIAVGEARNTR